MQPENPLVILGRKIFNLTLIAVILYILYLFAAIVTSAIKPELAAPVSSTSSIAPSVSDLPIRLGSQRRL
jgi:hypothetical protein